MSNVLTKYATSSIFVLKNFKLILFIDSAFLFYFKIFVTDFFTERIAFELYSHFAVKESHLFEAIIVIALRERWLKFYEMLKCFRELVASQKFTSQLLNCF